MSTNPTERTHAACRSAAAAKQRPPRPQRPPTLYQIVIECRDEAQQRELFERLQHAEVKLRLMVV